MRIDFINKISSIASPDWNRLAGDDNPFVQHQFLSALERNHCLEKYGWYPQHVCLFEQDKLIAAMPMYIKDNSYGELVFDWSWADAYHRQGLPYYPKLVTAIPYTPATGPRLLVHPDYDYSTYATQLIQAAIRLAEDQRMSSVHWLFTNRQDTELLNSSGMMLRLGCQFHWHNQSYESFDHYLEAFSSQKRKQIRRERKRVKEQHIELEIRHGTDMNENLWETYHRFYCSTFERKSGMPTLSLAFFSELGQTMAKNVVLVMAKHAGEYVASAFNLAGKTTLYGRHWGCHGHFDNLHFEACYYQGLEYCIDHQLARFEPGAQGEHKISRGFLPAPTWSAHWIADSGFAPAIKQFCEREQYGMQHYIKSLATHSPFKHGKAST